ncbi:MAG: mechanosensitive ion channel, partial [Desulfuromusa sp.]|nr:mechanosensitive ion channel [Desulfuromusa sp.]
KNERVTVPNASILSNPIINHTYSAENYNLIVYTSITIGYDVDWRIVHELLLDSATHVKGVLNSPKPFILQISLNDFYVEYQLNVYTDNANKVPLIRSNIHQNIQDNFRTASIEILSPHYRVNRTDSVGEKIEEIQET